VRGDRAVGGEGAKRSEGGGGETMICGSQLFVMHPFGADVARQLFAIGDAIGEK
jgi:hypothetical protein